MKVISFLMSVLMLGVVALYAYAGYHWGIVTLWALAAAGWAASFGMWMLAGVKE